MASNTTLIHKLQTALNQVGYRILYSTSQFYSMQQERPITVYYLKQAVWDDEQQKARSVELFHSTSQIQIVFFLRDMWYEANGMKVPTDNEMWNQAKDKYYEKQAEKESVE